MGVFIVLLVLNRLKVKSMIPFLILALPLWYFMLRSGIHPSISGVLLAFALPFSDGSPFTPSYKLQHLLHVPVAFIILPVFTIANTAIPIQAEFISGLKDVHAIGIGLSLIHI